MNQDYSTEGAKRSFLELRGELARVLGMQTVDLLIDRGVTEIREAYPILSPMTVHRGQLDVASFESAFASASASEAMAAINALTAVMLLIVARLVGRRIAAGIAEGVDKGPLMRSVRL